MRHEHSQLIDKAGGTVEVASMCNVSSQAVSKWRSGGIPRARLMYLRLARPDIFGASDPQPATPRAAPTDRRLGGDTPHVMPERRKHGEAA